MGGNRVSRYLVLLSCLALAAPAAAEPFIDLYFGGAFTEDDHYRDFENSVTGGLRVGFWGEGEVPFLGAALDISGHSPDGEGRIQGADIAVIPISALFLARLPLVTSDEYPAGQVQPYAGIGPSLVISRIDFSLPGPDLEDVQADLGLDMRVGVRAQLTPQLGVFGEYRFTHFTARYSDSNLPSLTNQFDTHYLQTGLSINF